MISRMYAESSDSTTKVDQAVATFAHGASGSAANEPRLRNELLDLLAGGGRHVGRLLRTRDTVIRRHSGCLRDLTDREPLLGWLLG